MSIKENLQGKTHNWLKITNKTKLYKNIQQSHQFGKIIIKPTHKFYFDEH
jgi:hypothetical protein